MLQQNRTLDGVTADNMTLGALRARGWRFDPPCEGFDNMTLGALRSRGWLIYAAICEAVQGAVALPVPPLPISAVPARAPAPVATAPTPAPTIPAPSIEDRALAAVRQVAATASPPSVAEAAAARWRVSPEVRAEFRDNLPAYLTYCQARTAGRIRIIRDRTIIAYNLAPPGEPRPATHAPRQFR